MKRRFSVHQAAILASLLCFMATALPAQDASGIESDNGRVRTWRLALGAAILGPPVAQTGSVAAVCDDNSVRVASQEGRLLWTYLERGKLLPWLSRSPEGTNYVGTARGELLAINRAGRLIWRRPLAAPLSAGVLRGFDGRLYCPSAAGIEALSAAGRPLWHYELSAAPALLAPDPARGGVFACEGDTLIALDPWGSATRTGLGRPVRAIAGLPSGEGENEWMAIAALDSGELIRVSAGGSFPFTKLVSQSAAVALAARDNTIYTLTREGTLIATPLEDGTGGWQGNTAAQGGGILLADERGIYALGRTGASAWTADGRRLWNLGLSDSAAIAAFSDDGFVYSGGRDWVLYAYRAEDRLKSDRNALYAPASGRQYGLGAREELDEVDRFLLSHGTGVALLLQEIEEALADSSIAGEEPAMAARLLAIAASGSNADSTRNTPLALPPQRVRALELLCLFSSPEQIPVFIDIFRRDPDPYVRASAAEAIGKTGVDPYGRALAAFEAASVDPRDRRDDLLMSAIARATGALCRFSGPPLSERGIRLLTVLSGPDRDPVTRRSARTEIELFRRPSR